MEKHSVLRLPYTCIFSFLTFSISYLLLLTFSMPELLPCCPFHLSILSEVSILKCLRLAAAAAAAGVSTVAAAAGVGVVVLVVVLLVVVVVVVLVVVVAVVAVVAVDIASPSNHQKVAENSQVVHF